MKITSRQLRRLIESALRRIIRETIKKTGDDWVVYPKKGGKRLGTHKTKKAALKQLAAIEINKNEDIEK